jgi:hypothetical protein
MENREMPILHRSQAFVSQQPIWSRETFSLPEPPGKEKNFFSATSVSLW